MSKLSIGYNRAPCGAGKSYSDALRKITVPGRYVIVRDRVEAIEEYTALIHRLCAEHGASPVIVPIIADGANRGHSVRNEVEALPDRYNTLPHVIAIITHRAMMMSDFDDFHGWHITIDETPVILDRQDIVSKRSTEFFDRHYQLDEVHPDLGWSAVTLSEEGWNTTGGDLETDDGNRYLKVFHDRVTDASPVPEDAPARILKRAKATGRAVVCNLSDWSEMEDGRRWTWWSLWSPNQLAAFASIEFLANGFDQSVTFALLKAWWPDIEWYETHVSHSRTFAHRTVRIVHFARKHVASKTFFESEDGREHLRRIAAHVARHDAYIWTANDAFAASLPSLDPASKLRPHQAGSNRFDRIDVAAMIYSAKPSAESRAVMKLLDVDPDVWTSSYEYEPILQFMCRTSIRRTDSDATVTLYVYDENQADYLAKHFRAASHLTVEVECRDLGFADLIRTTSGVVARVLTPTEAEERAEAQRKRKRLNQAARRKRLRPAGEIKRGRPTKVKS